MMPGPQLTNPLRFHTPMSRGQEPAQGLGFVVIAEEGARDRVGRQPHEGVKRLGRVQAPGVLVNADQRDVHGAAAVEQPLALVALPMALGNIARFLNGDARG